MLSYKAGVLIQGWVRSKPVGVVFNLPPCPPCPPCQLEPTTFDHTLQGFSGTAHPTKMLAL